MIIKTKNYGNISINEDVLKKYLVRRVILFEYNGRTGLLFLLIFDKDFNNLKEEVKKDLNPDILIWDRSAFELGSLAFKCNGISKELKERINFLRNIVSNMTIVYEDRKVEYGLMR